MSILVVYFMYAHTESDKLVQLKLSFTSWLMLVLELLTDKDADFEGFVVFALNAYLK